MCKGLEGGKPTGPVHGVEPVCDETSAVLPMASSPQEVPHQIARRQEAVRLLEGSWIPAQEGKRSL